MHWQIRNQEILLNHTLLMGVVNVTPDSFSGDGVLQKDAQSHAAVQLAAGVDILDIGAESSRPGALPLSIEEELARLQPVVSHALTLADAIVSVDTYKPQVAQWALEQGAHIINDIQGGRNEAMLEVVGEYKAGYVLMHMQGTPTTMQQRPTYDNIIDDLVAFFEERLAVAERYGVSRNHIMLDPGIGFGKTLEHNLEIIRQLPELRRRLPLPWLIGSSRKSFIGTLTGKKEPQDRAWGTAASVAIAAYNGAAAVRVHDVAAMKDVLLVADGIKN